jgi:FMN-dependent NADH-azoreductase
MKLLHIDSGILGEHSVSRRLTAAIVQRITADNPDAEVTYRDLAADPIGHLSGAHVMAAAVEPDQRRPELNRDLASGAEALEEFLAADVVVVGAPMYNFSIPSQLKAWIDRLAEKGKTFRYTATGPEGLAGGKKVILASTRGGLYGPETPQAAFDHQEAYLKIVFGFFGVTDIEVVRAEGLNLSPEAKHASIAEAERGIAERALVRKAA